MAKLFVSYSRKDSVAARKLIEAFKSVIGQEVWVDWEAIPPAVDWLEQIFRGIEEADAFIFMISPDSIASEVCKVEIGRAVLNNKRIIPIVLRDVNPKDTLEHIRKLNWTFIRETDNLDEGLAKVKTAIELDLDWLEEHRRLQVRALEWHRRKDPSLLLRGRDLRNARRMLQTYTQKDPIPTELQRKYIDFSQRTDRTRTIMVILTVCVAIIMSTLAFIAIDRANEARVQQNIAEAKAEEARLSAIYANQQREEAVKNFELAETNRKEAEKQRELAEARKLEAEAQRSAATAQIHQGRVGELFTSTLFAIDSWIKSPSAAVERLLRQNISLLPIPVVQISQNGSIDVLEMHPNGDTFLSVSADGTVSVRNIMDGDEIFSKTYASAVNDAIFVRDGSSIAVAEESGAVHVLNAATGEPVRDPIDAGSPVRDLDAARDGQTLAIARQNGNITILEIDEPLDQADNFFLSGGNLSLIDFSDDGRWLAAGGLGGRTAIWRLDASQDTFNSFHRGAVLSLQLSPSNRFVVSGGADNYAIGFDIQLEDEAFKLPHLDWVTDIDFPSGASTWFVTGSDDTRVRVWELSTAQERLTMLQQGAIADVTISSANKLIASTGDDKTARVWSASSGVEIYQIPLKAPGTTVAFNNDDSLLITGDQEGHLHIWDLSEIASPAGYTELSKLALVSKFTPTGNNLIASDASQIWLLDSSEYNRLGARPPANPLFAAPQGNIQDIVISPNSQFIGVATDGEEYFVQNVRTSSSERIDPSGDADPSALAFSADSSLLITGTADGTLETWEARTGAASGQYALGDSIYSLASSPQVLAAGLAEKIVLLDPYTGGRLGELASPGENQFLAFNPDGSLLVSVNSDGQIQTWTLNNGDYERLQLEPLSREPASAIALNPAGDLLAVGTADNVYLIDPLRGREVGRIPHKGNVYSVSFSPDGNWLATTSQRAIQYWDIASLPSLSLDDPVQAACSRLIENFSQAQWETLFGSEPYRKLCPNLPGPETE